MKYKVIFEPGCFDNFDGTQEELDELVKQITKMVEEGDMMDVIDEFVDEEHQKVLLRLDGMADSLTVGSMEVLDDVDIDNILPNRGKTLN